MSRAKIEATETLQKYLCSPQASATKLCLERSLNDVFRVMFDLDLSMVQNPAFDEKDSVSAYVVLTHEKATACVSLRILRATALLIAERAGVDITSTLTAFILQDVACEIVNIIANNLRTFLSENLGMYFEMGEVIVDKADIAALRPSIVINLDFQVTPEALINLGFMCGEGAAMTEASC